MNQTVINISGLKAGLYIVRFSNGNGQTETTKLIKEQMKNPYIMKVAGKIPGNFHFFPIGNQMKFPYIRYVLCSFSFSNL